LISTGVISCTNYSFVKKKDIPNQQFSNTINQDGNDRQALPQPEEENITSQVAPASIPTRMESPSPSLTANTEDKQSVNKVTDKEHVDNPPVVEQSQIKLNQVGLAHLDLGIAYAEKGLIDQAICEFQSAIEANPHHLESYVQLGTTYGLKGMANEAQLEFKKAIDINLNEAVAKIVFSALPVTANQKGKTDVAKAHINLGNAYKEEGKLKRSRIEYEKALALNPKNSIASKSLSEIYYTIGASCLENKEYDGAVGAFNKVVELNPGFPQIKDALEKAHYNLGINYAENGKLDKAIIEFNKTMEINLNYAMLDKNSLSHISNDKKAVSDKNIHHDRNLPDENADNSTNSDIRKESFHKAEEEPLQDQLPHQIGVAGKMILAEKDNTKKPEEGLNQAENQRPLLLQEDNKRKLVRSNKPSFETEQSQKANEPRHEREHLKTEKSNRSQGKKQTQDKIAHVKTVNTEETDINDPDFFNQERDASLLVSGEEDPGNPNYRVFTYNITRNYKPQIRINEAIKKYEDATINNPYDNKAFLNLAHAYYSKAMYLDDAIARREDAQEGNQNFSVKRFYLSETSLTGSTNTFDNAIAFRNRPGKIYEEMFREAIVEYKSALRTNPNSSSSLYGLAFSFSVKGSHLEIASRDKKRYKKHHFNNKL
jgi:tetratricopeptide (TPR) repeat protein